ncbi:MAG: D-glycerate dehydrogenase [Desulfobacterales bacterium]|nr:D-glycerate dehydrogenase [Desulfobacterales bacterium]
MKHNIDNKKIFVSRIFPEIGIEMFHKEGFDVTSWSEDRPMTQAELIGKARQNNALFCTLMDKIDKSFLNECKHLDIISQFGVGYDNIDIPEATRLGIPIGFTPDALTDATADIAFALMLAASRKMFYQHKSIIKGKWDFFRPTANLGLELKGRTLGVFGLGRIGIEMAKRCKGAYNMNILYCNRSQNKTAEDLLSARLVSFKDLLSQSDILSVHCALTEKTKGIFDKTAFSKMKPSAIFINTSRGLVHNEEDLIAALINGDIWGAGLDVSNPEPMSPDSPLLSMENVAVLPHIGSATIEARSSMSRMAAENIIEFYKHNSVPNIVNPETITPKC